MSTLDGPGPFDDVDQESLSDEEWTRRLEAWSEVKRAEALAERGGRPLVPGVDFSTVKAADVPGPYNAPGMAEFRRRQEEKWRKIQEDYEAEHAGDVEGEDQG